MKAFDILKKILSSDDSFTKPFDLTTGASSKGLGAVLSQGKRPITIISRTL